MPDSDQTDKQHLKEILDQSSMRNRTLFIAFLFLLTYIMFIVWSTTDLQLFVPDSTINLPLVNISASLFGFYLMTPIILLAVHFNLLFNLKRHQIKLTRWLEYSSDKGEEWLLPFLFNYTLDSRLLRNILSIVIRMLPPGILLCIQIRFSAYQSVGMTFVHSMVVLLDTLIMLRYWNDVFPQSRKIPQQSKGLTTKVLKGLTGTLKRLISWIKKAMVGLICTLNCTTKRFKGLTGTFTLEKLKNWMKKAPMGLRGCTTKRFKGLTGTFTLEKLKNWIKMASTRLKSWTTNAFKRLIGWIPRSSIALIFIAVAFCNLWATSEIISGVNPIEIVDPILEKAKNNYLDPILEKAKNNYLVGSLLGVPGKIKELILKPLPELQRVDQFLEKMKENEHVGSLLGVPGKIKELILKPHLELQEEELVKKLPENWGNCVGDINSVKGYDLQKRSLNFANFQDANLAKIDFRGANLCWANLANACLQETNLSNSEFQGADLSGAQFQGADLREAQFQEANLREAQFQGADLREAQFQEADLREAQFQGADLGAEFQGTDLLGEEFQGTDLRGANLLWAEFQGANLLGAEFQGANLWGAEFQGANLWGAKFQGANLMEAEFQGANLMEAEFQGANLWWAKFQGADLRRAKFQGADLRRAKLKGANLNFVRGLDALVVENINWETGVDKSLLKLYDEESLLKLNQGKAYQGRIKEFGEKYRVRIEKAIERIEKAINIEMLEIFFQYNLYNNDGNKIYKILKKYPRTSNPERALEVRKKLVCNGDQYIAEGILSQSFEQKALKEHAESCK